MENIKMMYNYRSLYYSTEEGWCLQRCFAYRGTFWVQLSTKHLG